jgi:competence protein ComGC
MSTGRKDNTRMPKDKTSKNNSFRSSGLHRCIFLFLVLGLMVLPLLIACKKKPENPVEEYGTALIGSYKHAQNAGVAANLDAVQRSVQAYRAANGKFPESLEELKKDFMGSDIDMSAYDYDPETGTVSIKK